MGLGFRFNFKALFLKWLKGVCSDCTINTWAVVKRRHPIRFGGLPQRMFHVGVTNGFIDTNDERLFDHLNRAILYSQQGPLIVRVIGCTNSCPNFN